MTLPTTRQWPAGLLFICASSLLSNAQAGLIIDFLEDPGNPGSAVIRLNGSVDTSGGVRHNLGIPVGGSGTTEIGGEIANLNLLEEASPGISVGPDQYRRTSSPGPRPSLFSAATSFTFGAPASGVTYDGDGYGFSFYFAPFGNSTMSFSTIDIPDIVSFNDATMLLSIPWSAFLNQDSSTQSTNFTPGSTTPEWQINTFASAVVPAPSSLLLLGGAFTCWGLRRRKVKL